MMAPARNWERVAARENKRRIEQAPLLAHAGLVRLTTPEEREARKARIIEQTRSLFAEREAMIEDKIAGYLQQLGEHRPLVEAHLRIYPRGDLWLDVLGRAVRRIGEGLPPLEEAQQNLTPEEREAGNARVRATLAVWAAVDAQHPEDAAAARAGNIAAVRRMSERRRAAERADG